MRREFKLLIKEKAQKEIELANTFRTRYSLWKKKK
jgi:hypothetical protein